MSALDNSETRGAWEVLRAFLLLGCSSFGGPVAHIGYFQAEFVERRRWLGADEFAEFVALAQSLPGPSSSQVGYAIGLRRAGLAGGLAAWVGFTTPSAVLMLLFAFGHSLIRGRVGLAVLHGLQLVAVAVVAQAVLAMRRTVAPDWVRLAMALVAAAVVLFVPGLPAGVATLLVIGFGAVVGLLLLPVRERSVEAARYRLPVWVAVGSAVLFGVLLVASVVGRSASPSLLGVAAAFFRAGAMVFGGGHVVLPLLDSSVVAAGWLGRDVFLAGYGAAQAVPGPLFTFAAFVGAAIGGVGFGLVALVAIFLPGFLLMNAGVPVLARLRGGRVRAALDGVNAAVLGVLLAALVRPVFVGSVFGVVDLVVVLAAFGVLVWLRWAPWVVVVGVAVVSAGLSLVG